MIIEDGDSDSMEIDEDMESPVIDKMDPRYIAACIEEVPMLTDPKEAEIIRVMEREFSSTPLAREMIVDVRQAVKTNWRDLYAHRHDSSYVRIGNQEGAAEVARITNATVVFGQEHLQEVRKGEPVFFSANHFGFFKLVGFRPDDLVELGFDGEHALGDIYYPPTPFYAPLYPVAQMLNDDIYMAAEEEPGILGELSRATGSIDVPPASMLPGFQGEGAGRVDILTDATRKLFEEHPSSALTVYPEGGTTGKRNGGEIYNLGRFHAGLFAIASQLEAPIVLLAHRFNPNKGFEIAVAGTVRLGKNSTREEIQGATDKARDTTQVALDRLRAA